jgi:hypothetical protein
VVDGPDGGGSTVSLARALIPEPTARDAATGSRVEIWDTDDLVALRSSRQLYSGPPVAVRLPWLSRDESDPLSARLNAARDDCGCSTGAATMAACFVGAMAWALLWHGFHMGAVLRRFPLVIIVVFAGAGVGKAVGISLARRRVRHVIDRLLAECERRT